VHFADEALPLLPLLVLPLMLLLLELQGLVAYPQLSAA
jgi:hypothetical protein